MKKVFRGCAAALMLAAFAASQAAADAFGIIDAKNGADIEALLLQQIEQYLQDARQLEQVIKEVEIAEQDLKLKIRQATGLDISSIDWGSGNPFESMLSQSEYVQRIRSMVGKIDGMLADVKKAKDAISSATVDIGGTSFSLSDLLSISSPEGLSTFGEKVYGGAKSALLDAAEKWSRSLSDDERLYIRQQYGMDATDYKMLQDAKQAVKDKTAELVSETEKSLEQVNKGREDFHKANGKFIEMLSTNPDMSQLQVTYAAAMGTHLNAQATQQLVELFQDSLSLQMYQQANEEREKAAKEAEEERARIERAEAYNRSTVPDWFFAEREDTYSNSQPSGSGKGKYARGGF